MNEPEQSCVRVYTQEQQGQNWLQRHRGKQPLFACVLGFTATGLIPGISAAGATPADREYTAIADAEFLINGPQPNPQYPLPPLHAGASPVLISRAVVEAQQIPVYLFNAGLPHPPSVPAINLNGSPAACLSQGEALELKTVKHLFQQGWHWGEKLAAEAASGYVMIGECVVGGTTTALAILEGLGISATGKVNSSHPICNHSQKWALVTAGLQRARLNSFTTHTQASQSSFDSVHYKLSPRQLVAAVGDPMQITVAGMTVSASRHCGVMLAGGTQMLAVFALARTIAQEAHLSWQPEQVVVGTTRWVAEDVTADAVGLAQSVGDVSLIATQLNFSTSRYQHLQAYEQGYVKEGVGAGACAIAAHLYQNWSQKDLLQAIEALAERYDRIN